MDLDTENDLSLSEFMDLVEEETVTTRVQPAFFENSGVDPAALARPEYWNMPDNEEHLIGDVASNGAPYRMTVTKSNNYCFLKLARSGNEYAFFFNCDALLESPLFFRELQEECPYPLVKPPSPPTEEVCYLYAKRAAETIEKTITVLGENAERVADCYISVVEKTTPGKLESKCTREAIQYEW